MKSRKNKFDLFCNFPKKYTRILFFLFPIIFIILIFLISLLARNLGQRLDLYVMPDFAKPGYMENSDSMVDLQLFFNDDLGSKIFSDLIIDDLNSAQHSIEIAMYALSSPDLVESIYKADRRGVRVFLILDGKKQETHDQAFRDLPSSITRLDIAGRSKQGYASLMHHKFAIIDRGRDGQKLLFGSYNWTQLQEEYDPSFIMRTTDQKIIDSFGREFDLLSGNLSGVNKISMDKHKIWDLSYEAGGYHYEVWFGPGSQRINFSRRIAQLIEEAKQDIKVMIWNFTDISLADKLLERALAGVKVTIIADNYNYYHEHSVFPYLENVKNKYSLSNLEILTDDARQNEVEILLNVEGNEEIDPFLHHHLLIVDNDKVLFGTNNWSKAGSYFNDESMIVTNDRRLLKGFLQSFDFNYRVNR